MSKLDRCLLIGGKVMWILFVDDLLFWSKDKSHVYGCAIIFWNLALTCKRMMMLKDFQSGLQ